jgi:lipid-A-disaccharide synthase-like uncharacterized protein
VKWEALLAMIALMFLGFWLVWGQREPLPEGSEIAAKFQLGSAKGAIAVRTIDGERRYQVHLRDGTSTDWRSAEDWAAVFPEPIVAQMTGADANPVFRIFNITSWVSLGWVAVGLLGQTAFFGRMAIQWVLSERKKESHVPTAFWYLSLVGGVALFSYFAWRQDIVGVLGQTTGVVIYARNIRLIHKQRRRAIRRAHREAERAVAGGADPAGPAPAAGGPPAERASAGV